MLPKFCLLALVLIAAAAQDHHKKIEDIGHAYSSQSIVLHNTQDQKQAPVHQEFYYEEHKQPEVHHEIKYNEEHLGKENQAHGHAYSSQSIVLHHAQAQKQTPAHHEEYYYEEHKKSEINQQQANKGEHHETKHVQVGDHGHAYSSQSIVHHNTQEQKHAPAYYEEYHYEQHQEPVVLLVPENKKQQYGHQEAQLSVDNHHQAQDYGHAYSSQNIVLHQTQEPKLASAHHEEYHYKQHKAPVALLVQEHKEQQQGIHEVQNSLEKHHQAQNYGHAYSSQNFVLHHTHDQQQAQAQQVENHYEQHKKPIVLVDEKYQEQQHGHQVTHHSQEGQTNGQGYSSQNIVLHHIHEQKQDQAQKVDNSYQQHKEPVELFIQKHKEQLNRHQQVQHSQDHQAYGQAYSTQNIVLHHTHEHEQAEEHQVENQYEQNKEPVVLLIQKHKEQLNGNQQVQYSRDHQAHGQAYSSQNIVLHHTHEQKGDADHHAKNNYEQYKEPVVLQIQEHKEQQLGHQEVQQSQDYQAHGQAYSSQNIVLHHTHEQKQAPVHEEYNHEQHKAPVVLLIQDQKKQQHGHHEVLLSQDQHHQALEHGNAYSSQNIVLHQAQKQKQAPVVHVEYKAPVALNVQEYQEQKHGEVQVGHQALNYQEAHGHAYSSQSIKEHHDGHVTKHIEYYGHPKYEFAYDIKDPHTHDIKNQHEIRDGDVVKGVYSLHQPDGVIRTVKYHADKKSGFNADVKYEGHAVHVVPEKQNHH